MLAKESWFKPEPPPISEDVYADFDFLKWEALLAEPNREERSHTLLKDRLKITLYWPRYTVQVATRFKGHRRPRQRSVLPGLLLAPVELRLSDKVLDFARLRPIRFGPRLHLFKAEIEIIREMEALLNVPPREKGQSFKAGERVRFTSDLWAAFCGDGTVIGVASGNGISVKVDHPLIGGKDVIVAPAAELETI
jgi:hypothetical protein